MPGSVLLRDRVRKNCLKIRRSESLQEHHRALLYPFPAPLVSGKAPCQDICLYRPLTIQKSLMVLNRNSFEKKIGMFAAIYLHLNPHCSHNSISLFVVAHKKMSYIAALTMIRTPDKAFPRQSLSAP